jgi:CRP-like cAMP-binding protein
MRRKTVGSDGAERLAQIALFADLSVGQRRALARLVEDLEASPGEELMHEGDFGYEVVLVEEGSAEVIQDDAVVNTVRAGEIVGELAVLGDGGPRTATVRASTPLRGMVLPSHFMHHVRRQMPEIADAVEAAAAAHRERDATRAGSTPPV